jgi:magnesium and cobalt transporter
MSDSSSPASSSPSPAAAHSSGTETRQSPKSPAIRRGFLERLSSFLGGRPEDRDALLEVLRDAHDRQLLDADALSMIEGVIQVAELAVRDVMLPRPQIDMLDVDWDVNEWLDFVQKAGHSRYPVYDESRDHVIGVLHAKDLLKLSEDDGPDIRDLLRPAIFIPESKRLNVLLREFRANRNHVAMVVDEYGGVAGMITIEDILEQIVGDIEDKFDYDDEADHIVMADTNRASGRYRVRAITPNSPFNEQFGSQLSESDFDTVGGLVTDQFGRVPRRGEHIDLQGFRFEVLRTDARQLDVLLVERLANTEMTAESST